jgi:hypothetical protein
VLGNQILQSFQDSKYITFSLSVSWSSIMCATKIF